MQHLTVRHQRNGRYFADHKYEGIFLKENLYTFDWVLKLTACHHCIRIWLVAEQVSSHYLRFFFIIWTNFDNILRCQMAPIGHNKKTRSFPIQVHGWVNALKKSSSWSKLFYCLVYYTRQLDHTDSAEKSFKSETDLQLLVDKVSKFEINSQLTLLLRVICQYHPCG